MKIVSIFAEQLYAFHYEGDRFDIYRTLQELWRDQLYLEQFFEDNKSNLAPETDYFSFEEDIIDSAFQLNDELIEAVTDIGHTLDEIFKPFHNQEHQIKMLSIRKKARHSLRLYAVRITDNLYVITSGTIKVTRTVQESEHSNEAYQMLKKGRDFLAGEGIFDEDSFREWKSEQ